MKIKKIIFLPIILIFALTVSLTAGAVIGIRGVNSQETKPPLRIGDLDLNGECNVTDLVRLKKYSAGAVGLDALQKKQADCNGDAVINGLDIAELRRNLLGGVSYGDNYLSLNELKSGTVYYVSADGTDDKGTDINAPMSLKTANSKLFSSGDSVFFKAGDVFYGTADLKLASSGGNKLTVSSYGKGAMPVFSGAAVVTDENAFTAVVDNYMYSLDLSDTTLFSEGFLSGDGLLNIGFITDGKNIYGDRKTSADKLTKQYDFCIKDNKLYVLCNTNPVKGLGKVMLATNNSLFKLNSNMSVSGLCFAFCGGNAVCGGDATVISNVTVKNCVIENVGGSLLYTTDSEFVRYGNGIEFYNKTVYDATVSDNIIRNCYDVGFTVQGNSVSCSGNNITVSKNVFYRNKQSSEIFIENAASAGIKGYSFKDNICIGSGSTWGNFPSNPRNGVPCEFLFYNYYPSVLDMSVTDNLIMGCTRLYWWSGDDTELFVKGVKSSNNKLYVKNGAISFREASSLAELQSVYQKELGSQLTFISDMSEYSSLTAAAASAYSTSEVFSKV